ncbi:class I SAM-dependent methyltransferase [Shewanella sp.]|nr:class I SAM-dependent methyltransferase [Shewanella sp.]
MNTPPYSQSCENNKAAIATTLVLCFKHASHVLEIGSGTGQHAVYFAKLLPHLIWQTSDQRAYHDGINAWITQAPSDNLRRPLTLDVQHPWPIDHENAAIDAIFSANTLHIMSAEMVEQFFIGVGLHLCHDGDLCLYGPFNYQGQYSSESNADFDRWLASQYSHSAIRDIEWITALANAQQLKLIQDISMPANNRLLHFKKQV